MENRATHPARASDPITPTRAHRPRPRPRPQSSAHPAANYGGPQFQNPQSFNPYAQSFIAPGNVQQVPLGIVFRAPIHPPQPFQDPFSLGNAPPPYQQYDRVQSSPPRMELQNANPSSNRNQNTTVDQTTRIPPATNGVTSTQPQKSNRTLNNPGALDRVDARLNNLSPPRALNTTLEQPGPGPSNAANDWSGQIAHRSLTTACPCSQLESETEEGEKVKVHLNALNWHLLEINKIFDGDTVHRNETSHAPNGHQAERDATTRGSVGPKPKPDE